MTTNAAMRHPSMGVKCLVLAVSTGRSCSSAVAAMSASPSCRPRGHKGLRRIQMLLNLHVKLVGEGSHLELRGCAIAPDVGMDWKTSIPMRLMTMTSEAEHRSWAYAVVGDSITRTRATT